MSGKQIAISLAVVVAVQAGSGINKRINTKIQNNISTAISTGREPFVDKFTTDEVLNEVAHQYWGDSAYSLSHDSAEFNTRWASVKHPLHKISFKIYCEKSGEFEPRENIHDTCRIRYIISKRFQ